MIRERQYAEPVANRRAEITKIDALLRDFKQACGGDRFNPDYRRLTADLVERRRDLSRQQPADRRSLRRFHESR